MTSPLVSAARALAKSQCGEDCFDALEEEAQASLIEDVRAVLGAIREPSEAMAAAGDSVADEWYYGHTVSTRELSEAYRAMIDKALSE